MAVARRRWFSKAFKQDAAARAVSSGLPMERVAAELGVHETMLRRWIASYSDQPLQGGESPAPGNLAEVMLENARIRAENEQILADNERLRAEKETLKRALAIIFAELN